VLVSAYTSDLGDELEAGSGYFDRCAAAAAMPRPYLDAHWLAGARPSPGQGHPLAAAAAPPAHVCMHAAPPPCRPWQWDRIRANAGFVVQFAARDDPFLPWDTQAEAAQGTEATLVEVPGGGHFMTDTFPQLEQVVRARLDELAAEVQGGE
jgi:predicted alpha/beta hydrolase family esterase